MVDEPVEQPEPRLPTRPVSFRLDDSVIRDLDGLKAMLCRRMDPVRITRTDAVAYAIRYAMRRLASPTAPPEGGP